MKASQDDRHKLTQLNENKVEYTYGEIFFAPFLPMLDLVCPKNSDKIFWDIGCGSAKPVALAAMSGRFAHVKGVEFLSDLTTMAKQAMDELNRLAVEVSIDVCPISITQGDLLESGWQHEADVVYLSSVCFPIELTTAIKEQARSLKLGALIIALKPFQGDVQDFLTIVHQFKVLMTWGVQSVVVYKKIAPVVKEEK